MDSRSSPLVVNYFYDRTPASRAGLTALIRAVARANADGMPVEVEAKLVFVLDETLVPFVLVGEHRVGPLTSDAIYEAIARAHRSAVNRVTNLPAAVLLRRSRP